MATHPIRWSGWTARVISTEGNFDHQWRLMLTPAFYDTGIRWVEWKTSLQVSIVFMQLSTQELAILRSRLMATRSKYLSHRASSAKNIKNAFYQHMGKLRRHGARWSDHLWACYTLLSVCGQLRMPATPSWTSGFLYTVCWEMVLVLHRHLRFVRKSKQRSAVGVWKHCPFFRAWHVSETWLQKDFKRLLSYEMLRVSASSTSFTAGSPGQAQRRVAEQQREAVKRTDRAPDKVGAVGRWPKHQTSKESMRKLTGVDDLPTKATPSRRVCQAAAQLECSRGSRGIFFCEALATATSITALCVGAL